MAEAPKSQVALGNAVRSIRRREGLSQEELASRAGIHLTWVSHIESGRRNPGWSTVARVASALGVTMVELAAAAERLET